MCLEEFAATSPGIIARSFLHRHLVVSREGGREGGRVERESEEKFMS
jgi:hypothetical protein